MIPLPTKRTRRKTTAEIKKRSNMPTFLRPANLQILLPSLSLCILDGFARVVWIDKTTPLSPVFSNEPLLLDRTPNPVISSPHPTPPLLNHSIESSQSKQSTQNSIRMFNVPNLRFTSLSLFKFTQIDSGLARLQSDLRNRKARVCDWEIGF